VRLRALEAAFLRYVSNRRTGGTYYQRVENLVQADGVMFVCPKCYAALGRREGAHSVICWFVGKVPDHVTPGPGRWTPAGTGLDDLTFVPGSPPRAISVLLTAGCGWHGFVVSGDAT
jgi:hypothetical protein